MSRPKTLLGRGLALLMATGAMAIVALTSTTPANAAVETASASTHTKSISASMLTASSDPSTWDYTILGALKLNGNPVKGVTVTATLGSFSAKAQSGADGKWLIKVPTADVYTVSIDEKTLPKGFKAVKPVLKADLTMFSTTGVLFKFAGQTVATESITDQLFARTFSGLNFGLLLALAAIGITLIFGTTGLTNFAHGEIVTLGALTTWLLHAVLGWPILLAGLIAVIATGALGYTQDAIIWKPLRRRRMGLNQMMIVSIGLGIFVRYLYLLVFNGDTKDVAGQGTILHFGSVDTTDVTLWGMLIAVAGLVGVALFLTRTRIGKATRAVSDNSALASATGIEVESIIRIVWVFGAAITGLAGVLYGLEFQANWLTGNDIQLLLFAAVTLGGLGTAFGAAIGALIIGLVVEISTIWIPTELRYAVALVVLILVLVVRPQGVLGKKQRLG